ncbi:MAG: DUF3267 domain-containing protein [Clostridia bacterium]|nr:DUF3267 domain-containing protein [Clostridia bacterium]
MKHFETELPEGYRSVCEINAKNKKTGVILNVVALLIGILIFLLFAFAFGFRELFRSEIRGRFLLMFAVYFVGYIVYIVLHELVHGAAYKLLTHRKLTFGFALSVAYCGVPDIYVYRKASLIATLAPFVVFTAVLLPLALFVQMPALRFAFVLLFCSHVAGCVGDLYGVFLMLFRFRDPQLLVCDTGPKQTYYLPE